ncbi:MAG: hypothetical protein WA971_11175 [Microbacterium sp.]
MREQGHTRAVVIHASDAQEDIQRAVATAAALSDAYPGARIRIIVNGEALNAISQLDPEDVPAGVGVGVCSVGLRRRGIDESGVPEGVEVVPTAPLAIVEEQFNGAAYLRL